MSTDLKPMKSFLFQGLQMIANSETWTDQNQAKWLDPSKSFLRTTTEAALTGTRAGINGKTRNLSISDMGTVLECERHFAATYVGKKITNFRAGVNAEVYRGKGGTKLHEEVERLLPDGFVTPFTEKMRIQKLEDKGQRGWDRCWTSLPSIGELTMGAVTGKKRDGISGHIDGYLEGFQTGVELKTVPSGYRLPDKITDRYFGQAASYAAGYHLATRSQWKPRAWVWVFLPSDLRYFDPMNISTYRVFIKTRQELSECWHRVDEASRRVAAMVDAEGLGYADLHLKCYSGDLCEYCPSLGNPE